MKKLTFLIMTLCCVVAKAATEDLSIDNFNCWGNGDTPVTYQCSKDGSTITFNQTWGGGSWWYGGKDCSLYQNVTFEFEALTNEVYFEVSYKDDSNNEYYSSERVAAGNTSISVALNESYKNNVQQVTIKSCEDKDFSIILKSVYFYGAPTFATGEQFISNETHTSISVFNQYAADTNVEFRFTAPNEDGVQVGWGIAALKPLGNYTDGTGVTLYCTSLEDVNVFTYSIADINDIAKVDGEYYIPDWEGTTEGGITINGPWSGATFTGAYAILNQIDITIGSAGYATMMLPFAASIPEGMTVYTATIGKDAVTLNSVDAIAANTPYIVSGEAKTYTFKGIADAEEYSYGDNLVGTYETSKTINAGDYILYEGESGIGFYKAGSNVIIGQCHAYLPASAVPSEAKALRFIIADDANAITAMESDADATVVGRYTLNGTQIQTPQQGINILKMSDGTVRKVLVK